MARNRNIKADICLIVEGTYPYMSGGVSSWVHDLIKQQSHLTFHVVSIQPADAKLSTVFQLPKNLLGVTNILLQKLPEGTAKEDKEGRLFPHIERAMLNLQSGGNINDLISIMKALKSVPGAGGELLLNSQDAWKMLLSMYEKTMPESSFLDYFWSYRALMGGFYALLLADLPKADVYHAVCTGYAGVYAARAHVETGKPALLTEHGIYTNERRIEIALADWLYESSSAMLTIDRDIRDIRDLWLDTFSSYSRICYDACQRIITLFDGNQSAQLADGADPTKFMVIPNGVDVEHFSSISRHAGKKPFTVGMIGRVVPIKDVKTFLRATSILREAIPDLRVLVLGPTDEDPQYFQECQAMVNYMALSGTVTFTGKVNVEEYLGELDALVLTSISEAQPLVILEAGAAGVPTVATDVGACRELVMGKADERPALHPGGAITPLSNPGAVAQELYRLFNDSEYYAECSRAARDRVRRYYNSTDQHEAYRALYERYLSGNSSKRAA